MDDLLTAGKVFDLLDVTEYTLRLWIRRGILPVTRNELNWRLFSRVDVERIKARIKIGRTNSRKLL